MARNAQHGLRGNRRRTLRLTDRAGLVGRHQRSGDLAPRIMSRNGGRMTTSEKDYFSSELLSLRLRLMLAELEASRRGCVFLRSFLSSCGELLSRAESRLLMEVAISEGATTVRINAERSASDAQPVAAASLPSALSPGSQRPGPGAAVNQAVNQAKGKDTKHGW